ncbi:MAG: hypothetical protein AAF394_06210, partial [Planctomycetota bacterium]
MVKPRFAQAELQYKSVRYVAKKSIRQWEGKGVAGRKNSLQWLAENNSEDACFYEIDQATLAYSTMKLAVTANRPMIESEGLP